MASSLAGGSRRRFVSSGTSMRVTRYHPSAAPAVSTGVLRPSVDSQLILYAHCNCKMSQ